MRNILNSNNFIDNVIDPLFILLTDGFVALLLCTALILIDPLSMALTIGLVSMVAIAFHKFSKTRIEIWGVERQKMQSIRIQQINETFGGIKEVTLLGRDRFFKQKFESNVNQLSRINRKFSTIIVIPRLYLELLSITGLAVLVTSMLAMGRAPNSMLPILGLFAGGAFRLMPAINRITFAFQSFRMGGPIIQLMTDHMNQKPIDQIGTTVHPSIEFQKSIQFKSLTYKYEGSDDPALVDLSFEILKGSEIGIIGSTGAGKSTFVDVLLGLLSPTSGQVLVDGIDISRNLRGWQDLIGYVPQTIFLTDSSIEANIALGIVEDEIDYSKIDRALELAQLKTFVETLPNGKKTMVGERGVRLSGGQRQRIGIARALYNDPPILVFDEATSALDEETELEILAGLKKLSGRKTTIMITHRSAALINCKQIYEIADGGIRLVIVDK
jgi:ABC-type multidrug transport system fused ATPase/permease subunit